MTHTAIGLFPNSTDAEQAITELKAAGIAASDLRVAAEPRYMQVSNPLSTPGMDFCTDLALDLRAIGVTEPETQAFIQGVRNGGVLVYANGSIEQAEKFAGIMNCHHAVNVEEITGIEPALAEALHESAIPTDVDCAQAGRVRYAGSGARMFTW
jgi:hypothetical protein